MARQSTRAKGEPITIVLSPVAEKPTLQYCEGIRDPWRALNQGLCAVVRVAQGTDPFYALEAGKFLVEYGLGQIAVREAKRAAQTQNGLSPRQQAESRETILHELRGLYAKALGPTPAIVETVAEPVAEPAKPQS